MKYIIKPATDVGMFLYYCSALCFLCATSLLAADPAPTIVEGLQDGIVFCQRGYQGDGHYYARVGRSCADWNIKFYQPADSKLCILDPKSGKVTEILKVKQGGIRDPQVDYSGTKIIFAYYKKEHEYFNLYEINIDGTGLRQITNGPWDDIEPCYLPDGGIIFASTRAKRYVGCWFAPSTALFKCNPDGSGMKMLTSASFTENTPSVLPDGRVIFTRWEYVNRPPTTIHYLWSMRPDGTDQQLYFGLDAHVPTSAQAIPGTRDIVFVESNHAPGDSPGVIMVATDKYGTHNGNAMIRILPDSNYQGSLEPHIVGYRDVHPVDANRFLVAYKNTILLLDTSANTTTTIYTDASKRDVSEPRLVRPRPKEFAIPSTVNPNNPMGTVYLANAYVGRDMGNWVPKGSIKKILVLEDLSKPVNFHGGGTTPLSHGYSYSLKRILGTVPVEKDGSASFQVPPLRSIYLGLLDENDRCIKQMGSFMTLQPGENLGCVGCHEERLQTSTLASCTAMTRAPSRIEPIEGAPDIMDFPRDVQPILDRRCVSCHDAKKREGGVVLTGHRGPVYSLAFYNLILHGQMVGDLRGRTIPNATYSSASPIMKKIDGSHHDVKVTAAESAVIRLWVDVGAPYTGTYAALGTGVIGGWWGANEPIREMTDDWPTTAACKTAIEKRCFPCHTTTDERKGVRLPRFLTDGKKNIDNCEFEGNGGVKFRTSRHRVFDLTVPEESLILLAPLAREKGGYAQGELPADGKPKPGGMHMTYTFTKVPNRQSWTTSPNPYIHHVVFQSTEDPDYQAILAHIQAGKARLDEIKRFDMPGFRPCKEYVRDMIRYGVLPETFDLSKDPIDVYQTDQKYYKSFWSEYDRNNTPK